jgi:glycosyltransferase involved in cell wall biosynthesis
MRIAVVAPTELPARRANTLQVMKMCQALVNLGYDVRLAAPGKPLDAGDNPQTRAGAGIEPTTGPSWAELARHYGLQRQFPVDWLPANPRLRRYDYSWRAVQWARRWGADLLYTRLPQAAALGSLMGLKTVFEIHDLPQGAMGTWLFGRFLKGKGAYRLVVITRALAEDLSQQFGAPADPSFTVVAPDGVDLDRYAGLPGPAQARLELAATLQSGLGRHLALQTLTVGYTGHLYPGRGAQLILAIAARLPEVAFLVVGGEPQDVRHLQSEVDAQNLRNVILTGFVPNADLAGYQAACDVLLMPYQRQVAASSGGDISRYLSPMKLFEYLACGRAIVSSDLPVLQEVLNAQNAILLPCEDVEAWVVAIKDLQANPERRDKLAAQALRDARRYTWESRAKSIMGEEDD